MKQPQLKEGMDCTNLRTRIGTKVLKVVYEGILPDHPFVACYMNVDGLELKSNFREDGSYWRDGDFNSFDILELEEGEEGYVGEGEKYHTLSLNIEYRVVNVVEDGGKLVLDVDVKEGDVSEELATKIIGEMLVDYLLEVVKEEG